MLHKTRARNARPYGYGGTISRYFFPQHCRGAHRAPVIWNLCKISDLLIYCLCFYCSTIVWKLQMGTDSLGGELLQSRCARQLPRRGSSFGRFMTPWFFIRRNSFYLQSRPPSSRDVFHRRRLWRIQTMKNAEGWHAAGMTKGVVSRSYDGSRKKFVPRFTDVL